MKSNTPIFSPEVSDLAFGNFFAGDWQWRHPAQMPACHWEIVRRANTQRSSVRRLPPFGSEPSKGKRAKKMIHRPPIREVQKI